MRYFFLLPLLLSAQEKPFLKSELIFPVEKWHNHASAVVELSNGDLLACWYHGSGERTADDVIVEGARLKRGATAWNARFTLADTPAFPDTNPTMFIDSKQRLWLIWQAIIANQWETALTKYKVSTDYLKPGPPKWDFADNMLFVPRNFNDSVKRQIDAMTIPADERAQNWKKNTLTKAADKYFSRLGWMTRAHPVELPTGRMIVPLYSDGYSFSVMGISDDGGQTWNSSEPIVGAGNIQPTIARRKDGSLVAYMRDNGPAPKRAHIAESRDDGNTWSAPRDSDIPNPGAGLEVINLKDGSWMLIYNDTERDRNSLAVSISEDDGKSWKWTRHLEKSEGRFHYPSIIQARDGSLHATYSYFTAAGKSIKHAHFNVAWVKQGD